MPASSKTLNLLVKTIDESSDNLLAITGVVAGLGAGVLALKEIWDFSKEGAALQRLEDAGERLAASTGESFSSITRSIQEASGNTISELEAISQANFAMRLGVAQTPEEFDKLTTGAIALGRALGRTASESIADVTTGVGRMSKQILDNLGVVYDANTVYAAHAESINKVASALTDQEKKQALVNLVLESAKPLLDENGELIDDNASAYEQLEATLANYSNRLKEHTSEALSPFVAKMAELIQTANEAILIVDEMGLTVGRFGLYYNAAGEVVAKTIEEMVEAHQRWLESLGFIPDAVYEATHEYWRLQEVLGVVKEAAEEADEAIGELRESEILRQAALALMRGDIEEAQRLTDLAFAAEEYNAQLEAMIAYLDSLDGKTINTELVFQITQTGSMPSGVTPFTLGTPTTPTTPTTGGDGAYPTINGWPVYPWSSPADIEWYRTHEYGDFPEYQTGGSFQVGGSGGPDSQVVPIVASPGEYVNISKEDTMRELLTLMRRMPTLIADAVARVL